MTRPPDATWLPVVSATTTADELEAAVATIVQWQMTGVVDRLLDGEWPPDVVDRAVRLVRPLVEKQTRDVLQTAVRRLRH